MYIYTLLCHFSNMALCLVAHSKERGLRSTWIYSSLPGLVHIIIQQQKQGKTNCPGALSIHGQWLKWICGGEDMTKPQCETLSILELSKKCWLNLWICHNIPFHHHTEVKVSLSFWVCDNILSSVNRSSLHHRQSLVHHRRNNLWKESRTGWMILLYNCIVK